MIEVNKISKNFEDIKAIKEITAKIEEGHVFGLIGTNGAGKSTFLRMLCGVLKPDEGTVLVDGENVYDNSAVKSKLFYISDDYYFRKSSTVKEYLEFLDAYYMNFDMEKCKNMLEKFDLSITRKINTFSKGMKKQLAVICGICANTKYLLCDETFDGLDPVMRQAVKAFFVQEMDERGLTPIIASHNLRELEDICEYVGVLHKGGILFEKDIDNLKLGIHKMQCVFKTEETLSEIKTRFNIMQIEQRGNLYTITIKGQREEVDEFMQECDPIFYELLPLSLEEIFISETEVLGYDIKKLIF